MKKLSFALLTIVTAATFFFTSCEKTSLTDDNALVNRTESAKLNNVKEENGVLRFESLKHLTNSLEVVKKNQKSLVWLDQQFPNFISSHKAYMSFSDADLVRTNGDFSSFKDYVTILAHDGERYAEPTVDGYLVSLLTSKSGLVLVANAVYKFTYDYVYTFDEQYLGNFLSKQVDVENIPGFTKIPIKRNVIYDGKDRKTETSSRWNVDACENQYESKRLIGGVISTTSYPFGTDIDATTKHRVKGFLGIWSNSRTLELKISGSIGVFTTSVGSTNGTFGTIGVNDECSDCGKITEGEGTAGYAYPISYQTTHRGKVNNNDFHECTLFQ
jgi:hypothetical protein